MSAVSISRQAHVAPDHLVALPWKDWALWRWVELRSAGFPAAGVLRLASPECAAAADALITANPAKDSDQSTYLDAFALASRALSADVQRVVRGTPFQEAVLWQNRRAFHTGIEPLLNRSPETAARTAKYRRREALAASYWQRYCFKNDTIGFFGPSAWARWVPWATGLEAKLGPSLLSKCVVYFEAWCIDMLAKALARDATLAPWMKPRRMPFIHVEGATLFQPGRPGETLPSPLAPILAACDGRWSAKELATRLLQDGSAPVRDEVEVYGVLQILLQRRLISWTFEVPVQTHPELHLRAALEKIGEPNLRTHALSWLDRLEQKRDAVRAASGDVKRLDAALGDLEATFTALTGTASTRSPGTYYAGRTLVYVDCLRDVRDISIGADVLEALGEPLCLLLMSARWLTYEVAARFRPVFMETFAVLSRKSGSSVVDLPSFWFAALPKVRDGVIAAAVHREFQRRWSSVLDLQPAQSSVRYSTAEIRERVDHAFTAPGPGWAGARYHSPDLFIEAPSVEAICRGDYRVVLGELHVALNTLRHASCVAQHPSPHELFASLDRDIPQPRVVPVPPRQGAWGTSRLHQGLVSRKDYRISFLQDLGGYPVSQALPMGSLLVEVCDGELVTRSRNGKLRFSIIEVFADALTDLVFEGFEMVEPSPHTPRIAFDRMIVHRETWRFRASEMPFAWNRDEQKRFLGARRWWCSNRLPRFVFVKTPVGRGFYVDFDSIPYVNILAKAARRAAEVEAEALVTVTEILPTHTDLWLVDADGNHYTSEFRMVAVDGARVADGQELPASIAGRP